MSEARRLTTKRDAAKYANVSLRTIDRWIASGTVTPYRYGMNEYFVMVDLDEIDRVVTPVAS